MPATTTTTKHLTSLLAARKRAWAAMVPGHKDSRWLRNLDAGQRFAVEMASQDFRNADRQIVEALRELPAPARVTFEGQAALLWLTSDRLNFAVVDAATGHHIHSDKRTGAAPLYRYPEAAGVGA